jgi:hypothetical protein
VQASCSGALVCRGPVGSSSTAVSEPCVHPPRRAACAERLQPSCWRRPTSSSQAGPSRAFQPPHLLRLPSARREIRTTHPDELDRHLKAAHKAMKELPPPMMPNNYESMHDNCMIGGPRRHCAARALHSLVRATEAADTEGLERHVPGSSCPSSAALEPPPPLQLHGGGSCPAWHAPHHITPSKPQRRRCRRSGTPDARPSAPRAQRSSLRSASRHGPRSRGPLVCAVRAPCRRQAALHCERI